MNVQAKKQNQQSPEKNRPNNAGLVLTYYTDPLCCWCWAFENTWNKLLASHGSKFQTRYVMAGMIRDWKSYQDPYNAIANPSQMAPLWVQVSRLTQCELSPEIWHHDPPSSSYPACIAVKAASQQSAIFEERYLFKVREAVMKRALNVSRESVLMQLAQEVHDENKKFDVEKFRKDLKGDGSRTAFRKDLERVAIHKIGRFPTLTCTDKSTGAGIMMVGYRSYDALLTGLQQMGV